MTVPQIFLKEMWVYIVFKGELILIYPASFNEIQEEIVVLYR